MGHFTMGRLQIWPDRERNTGATVRSNDLPTIQLQVRFFLSPFVCACHLFSHDHTCASIYVYSLRIHRCLMYPRVRWPNCFGSRNAAVERR